MVDSTKASSASSTSLECASPDPWSNLYKSELDVGYLCSWHSADEARTESSSSSSDDYDDNLAHLPDFNENFKASCRDLVALGAFMAGRPFTVAEAPRPQAPRLPREPKHRSWSLSLSRSALREPSAPRSFDLSFKDRLRLRNPRGSIRYLRAKANYKKVRFVEESEVIEFIH